MSETETTGDAQPTETKTINLEGPKIYFCQKCGSESDGFIGCLHTRTTVGDEIRCLNCYRVYVQSEEHLQNVQRAIPVLVRKPKA